MSSKGWKSKAKGEGRLEQEPESSPSTTLRVPSLSRESQEEGQCVEMQCLVSNLRINLRQDFS